MKVAVLSAGPSIVETWHGGSYDMIIGVNASAFFYDVDYGVALDPFVWKTGYKHGYDIAKTMRKGGVWWSKMLQNGEEPVPSAVQMPPEWEWIDAQSFANRYTFSIEAALRFADSMASGDTIDLYGHDMGGHGTPPLCITAMYGQERWQLESKIYNSLINKLSSRVNRILPGEQ